QDGIDAYALGPRHAHCVDAHDGVDAHTCLTGHTHRVHTHDRIDTHTCRTGNSHRVHAQNRIDTHAPGVAYTDSVDPHDRLAPYDRVADNGAHRVHARERPCSSPPRGVDLHHRVDAHDRVEAERDPDIAALMD